MGDQSEAPRRFCRHSAPMAVTCAPARDSRGECKKALAKASAERELARDPLGYPRPAPVVGDAWQ